MDTPHYLDIFQKTADRLDSKLFIQKNVEYKVGIWLKSVVVKFQKPSWRNPSKAKPFEESVFFGIWVNDESLRYGKINYNIHALKLRELQGYSIKSRDFADAFRSAFRPYAKKWPNVSVDFGPLTLMNGWVAMDKENMETIIEDLAYKFLEIAFIIDNLLAERKK